MTEKTIHIDGVDPRELFGVQDTYLEMIREQYPALRIVARGSKIKIMGEERLIEQFVKRFEQFEAYYDKYGHVSKEVIRQCFGTAGVKVDEQPAADGDVIVYGNNGNIIRARTANQRRLVDLFEKNDLLFAVGPAGSGKTYTAIALAVRALKENTFPSRKQFAVSRKFFRDFTTIFPNLHSSSLELLTKQLKKPRSLRKIINYGTVSSSDCYARRSSF